MANSSVSTGFILGFTPNGKGGGNWKEVLGTVGDRPFPSDIVGTSSGIFANDENDAYYAAGYILPESSFSAPAGSYIVNSGLLTFNFETLTFTNSSNLGLPFHMWGVMLNVPIYGSKGILLAVGGGSKDHPIGFNSIDIFDKEE